MTLAQRIESLRNRRFTSEDGDDYELELLPPMPDAEIDALEKRIPCPLPPEIRELLRLARGLENTPLDQFEFGGGEGFGLEEIFPHAESIGHDGFGNFWVVDLLPESQVWGPIYYACHDAPVIVYQAADLAEFLDALIEFMQPPFQGPIHIAHDIATHRIWSDQPNTLQRAEAVSSSDPELRAFGESVGDEWRIVDLRTPKIGDGFAWGRAKSVDDIRRWRTLPMFAYLPKKPLFARLFGR